MTKKNILAPLAAYRRSILAGFITFALVLFSCSDDNLPGASGELLPKAQESSNRIGMEEAMRQVEEAVAFLDKEHPSDSGLSRMVSSVSILLFGNIKSSALKSGEFGNVEISSWHGI